MKALLLLLLAVPSFSEDLEGARDNFDTVARGYAAQKSGPDGLWVLKQRGTGKSLKLVYAKAERETVHPIGGGRWQGIADFTDKAGTKTYFAELVIATGGDLWDVKSLSWKSAAEAADARIASLKAARATAARKPGPFGLLPDVVLSDSSGRETVLADCPAPKCLTVVVAPWCPYCHKGTGMIKEMRSQLAAKGIPTRVVVGKDSDAKVRDYAKEFGPDALLDADDRFRQGGVPHFYVSTAGGGVVNDGSGTPPDLDAAKYLAELGF